jgi:hypothetical protein
VCARDLPFNYAPKYFFSFFFFFFFFFFPGHFALPAGFDIDPHLNLEDEVSSTMGSHYPPILGSLLPSIDVSKLCSEVTIMRVALLTVRFLICLFFKDFFFSINKTDQSELTTGEADLGGFFLVPPLLDAPPDRTPSPAHVTSRVIHSSPIGTRSNARRKRFWCCC